jgi:hypothetical protein
MAKTDVDIATSALVLIGAKPITSFSGSMTEQVVANAVYEDIVESAIGLHRWRFATGQSQLSRLSASPEGRWDAAYQLPTDPAILQLNGITVSDILLTYDVYEDMVYCDATADDVVIADYVYRASETSWPATFRMAVIYDLAAAFATSIAREDDLAQSFATLAEIKYARARSVDSQQQPARRVPVSRFLNSRRGRTL